ncbi:MAG: hypothetical protein ACK52I_17415 [Pseudomonadota bacterium]
MPTVGPPDGSGQWFTDLAVQSYVNPSRATGFHVPKRASRVANAQSPSGPDTAACT